MLKVATLVHEASKHPWCANGRSHVRFQHGTNVAVSRYEEHGQTAVCNVGLDETISSRGHDYITLFVDREAQRLLFAAPGKDAKAIKTFTGDLPANGGDPNAIQNANMNRFPSNQKDVVEYLLKADITIDCYHLAALVICAVDEVRRAKVRGLPDLKTTHRIWPKITKSLKPKGQERINTLEDSNLKTSFAYQFFKEIFTLPDQHQGASFLKDWVDLAKECTLPVVKCAYTIQNRWDCILRWFETHLSNGTLEGFVSLLQSAKYRDLGCRTHKNFITMTYLVLGNRDLRLPI